MFRTLIDERGPWSANPFPNAAVTHWKLDKTEDSWRRRPKLKCNYHFDEKLCQPPLSAISNQDNVPVTDSKSSFVGHIPEQMKRFLLKGVRRITEEGNSETGEDDPSSQNSSILVDNPDRQFAELVKGNSDQKETVPGKGDSSFSSAEADVTEVVL